MATKPRSGTERARFGGVSALSNLPTWAFAMSERPFGAEEDSFRARARFRGQKRKILQHGRVDSRSLWVYGRSLLYLLEGFAFRLYGVDRTRRERRRVLVCCGVPRSGRGERRRGRRGRGRAWVQRCVARSCAGAFGSCGCGVRGKRAPSPHDRRGQVARLKQPSCSLEAVRPPGR